ncbi:hypothetical protein WMY93_022939 [Mugilogobius chulae]|uniref:Uncharacterized protein n=1 Tax=Mugilogobius chulae TaxID=88201 RepID=A0AAW0N4I4_9GOBI
MERNQTTPETKQTAIERKQTTIEGKQTTIEGKQTTMGEAGNNRGGAYNKREEACSNRGEADNKRAEADNSRGGSGNNSEEVKPSSEAGLNSIYYKNSQSQDLTLKHGWRTGAIIPELRKEIKIMNTEQYVHMTTWLQTLTGLIEQMQVHGDPASQAVVQEWIKEREAMRPQTKDNFNAQFGSLFRTYHNPTYFSRRLSRFADIYMASISCLLKYDLKHTFFPRRTPLQHESTFWPQQHRPDSLTAQTQAQRR